MEKKTENKIDLKENEQVVGLVHNYATIQGLIEEHSPRRNVLKVGDVVIDCCDMTTPELAELMFKIISNKEVSEYIQFSKNGRIKTTGLPFG